MRTRKTKIPSSHRRREPQLAGLQHLAPCTIRPCTCSFSHCVHIITPVYSSFARWTPRIRRRAVGLRHAGRALSVHVRACRRSIVYILSSIHLGARFHRVYIQLFFFFCAYIYTTDSVIVSPRSALSRFVFCDPIHSMSSVSQLQYHQQQASVHGNRNDTRLNLGCDRNLAMCRRGTVVVLRIHAE